MSKLTEAEREEVNNDVRKFSNKLALQLPQSNDTMKAIRLLHKELPDLLIEKLDTLLEKREKDKRVYDDSWD